jgi:hypothetical protein
VETGSREEKRVKKIERFQAKWGPVRVKKTKTGQAREKAE